MSWFVFIIFATFLRMHIKRNTKFTYSSLSKFDRQFYHIFPKVEAVSEMSKFTTMAVVKVTSKDRTVKGCVEGKCVQAIGCFHCVWPFKKLHLALFRCGHYRFSFSNKKSPNFCNVQFFYFVRNASVCLFACWLLSLTLNTNACHGKHYLDDRQSVYFRESVCS